MKTNFKQPNQKGAALITVLVIVFIVMAIISNMTVRNYRIIRRLTNQKIAEQAYSILLTAVSFGRAGLATSAATSSIDTLNDIWAQPILKTELITGIFMSGNIIDEQSKFNINDLVQNGNINSKMLTQFSNLLNFLNIPSGIASNIAYYMASPQNEENIMSQYTSGNPAYRPAGRPLIDLSELKLVKGMQDDWVYKLSSYVTAIPQPYTAYTLGYTPESNINNESGLPKESSPTPQPNTQGALANGLGVNINTASAEVIAARSNIPLTIAQRIITLRVNTPFQNQQDILKFLTNNGIMVPPKLSTNGDSVDPNVLTTQSNYFTIHAVVDSGDYEFHWIALVYRQNRTGPWPIILWQHPE